MKIKRLLLTSTIAAAMMITSAIPAMAETNAADAFASSYTSTGLTCGRTYYYKVRAYTNANGKTVCSKLSTPVSGKPIPSKTKVKEAWGGAIGWSDIYVEWIGIAGATDYEVQTRYTLNGKTTAWSSIVTTSKEIVYMIIVECVIRTFSLLVY